MPGAFRDRQLTRPVGDFDVRTLCKAACGLLACVLATSPIQAQSYPDHDITFIVAFAPGGIADTLARFVGKGLGEKLGCTVIVENRGGAGGNIAAAAVARAAPDGYTLLVTTTAVAINETLRPNRGYAVNDLKTVAIIASSPESLVTSPGNPAANLAEFLKANKGKNITFASAGAGSGSHIAAEYFFKENRQNSGDTRAVPRRRARDHRHHWQSGRHYGVDFG